MDTAFPAGLAVLEESLIRRRPESSSSLSMTPANGGQGTLRASSGRKPGKSSSPTSERGPQGSGAGRERTTVASAGPKGPLAAASVGARIGVIADNHGHLDSMILEIFAGVTHIIHAGDIMDPGILDRLAAVAPVTAVAGNMDSRQPTSALPHEVAGEVAGVRFVVGHKRKRLLKDLAAGNIKGLSKAEAPDLVVYGHDHMPAAAWVDGTLFLDPGSASAPHEEDDGPTVAIVEIRPSGLSVCFVPLPRSYDRNRAGGRT